MRKSMTFLAGAVLLAALSCQSGLAQVAPAILTIDVENWVSYVEDVFDVTARATNPGATVPIAARNFTASVDIADIVAVNGQPAKGAVAFQSRRLRLLPGSVPGAAVADVGRGSFVDYTYEILNADGTPVGSIMTSGFGGGARPPGAPLAVTNGNTAVIGGTGAFLGVRGQAGLVFTPGTMDVRSASISEDPANRRANGGGKVRYVLHLMPPYRPEIVSTASGPAIFHSDFTQVTPESPASAGEVLFAAAANLGPTRPGVDPGAPFPDDPMQTVVSPVTVTVNGETADAIAKLGWPGLADTYRVDFQMPQAIPPGVASIHLTAAWISGPVAEVPVQ